MSTILTLLLPALAAPIADVVKSLTRKWGGVTVDDEIKLIKANSDRAMALAELDRPADGVSKWVADLRASFRYVLAGSLVLLAAVSGLYCMVSVPELRPLVVSSYLDMTGAAFSFIFGERIYFRIKGN
jgi:hypothetical protein